MQNECTLIIDQETGDCKMVLTTAAKMLNLTDSPACRASHVYPANWLLRAAFVLIRSHCTDTSKLAAWSRTWPCLWQVDMAPVGGGILPGRWTNRLTAIDAEVEALNNFFIGEQS